MGVSSLGHGPGFDLRLVIPPQASITLCHLGRISFRWEGNISSATLSFRTNWDLNMPSSPFSPPSPSGSLLDAPGPCEKQSVLLEGR